MMKKTLPKQLFSGFWKEGHVQGIAVDAARGFVYYSFTTILLKTDFDGNPVGSVENLAGHLGCIQFDAKRNLVYGSLELKHDQIGKGIIARIGYDPSQEDAFYAVCFDVEKIDRMRMDAERDDVMKAVWLRDVVDDYRETDQASGEPHRYGCSGIDGTSLGPAFGQAPDAPEKLMIAYGVYENRDRDDCNYQVIRQYDPSVFETYGKPLCQSAPHHSGPEHSEEVYFLYTGNTVYGIQNLEYDAFSRNWLVSVYVGHREEFTNFPMFQIDGRIAPREEELRGRAGERGKVLTLAKAGEEGKQGIFGSFFPYGSTGIAAMGDGYFYFSIPESNKAEKSFCSRPTLYRLAPENKALFLPVEE